MRYYEITIKDPDGNILYPDWNARRLTPSQTGISTNPTNTPQTSGITQALSGLWIGTSIAAPQTSVQALSPSPNTQATFTSHPSGVFNPYALNIGFENYRIPVSGDPTKSSMTLNIWGLPVQMLGDATHLNPIEVQGKPNKYYTIELRVGMAVTALGQGLPLAVQQSGQRGIVFSGQILQSVGNWNGTEQTMTLYCMPGSDTILTPQSERYGFLLSVQPGDTVETAITDMMNTSVASSPTITYRRGKGLVYNPVATAPLYGHYPTLDLALDAISNHVRNSTTVQNSPDFKNYNLYAYIANGNSVDFFDKTSDANIVQLNIGDFIGQPTWASYQYFTIRMVMRADIVPGMNVKLPQVSGIGPPWLQTPIGAVTQPGQLANPNQGVNFSGSFGVYEVYNFGNYRDPAGDAWSTTLKCSSVSFGATGVNAT